MTENHSSSSGQDEPFSTTSKAALEHAWAWFSLHATQRLQSVNFFLIVTAFLSAAFVTAAKEGLHALAAGVSILGICVSYFFYRMERRIRSLIHAAENAIRPLQDQLAISVRLDTLRIVSCVEGDTPGAWKYSKVFRYLYFTTALTFSVGLLYVSWAALSTTTERGEFNNVLQAVLGIVLVFCGHEILLEPIRVSDPDRAQEVTRWSLVMLGAMCIIAGLIIICHLVFYRL